MVAVAACQEEYWARLIWWNSADDRRTAVGLRIGEWWG